jgi:hypothetical protein
MNCTLKILANITSVIFPFNKFNAYIILIHHIVIYWHFNNMHARYIYDFIAMELDQNAHEFKLWAMQDKQRGFIGINLFAYWIVPLTNTTEDAIASQRAMDFMIGW